MKKLVALMIVSMFFLGFIAQISEAGWVSGQFGLRYWDLTWEEPTYSLVQNSSVSQSQICPAPDKEKIKKMQHTQKLRDE